MTRQWVDVAAIRERHRRWVPRHECRICNQPWPCDAIQLAAALEGARADNEGLREARDMLDPDPLTVPEP